MTLRDRALECIRERNRYPVGSLDWEYRTRAALTYVRMALNIPVDRMKP